MSSVKEARLLQCLGDGLTVLQRLWFTSGAAALSWLNLALPLSVQQASCHGARRTRQHKHASCRRAPFALGGPTASACLRCLEPYYARTQLACTTCCGATVSAALSHRTAVLGFQASTACHPDATCQFASGWAGYDGPTVMNDSYAGHASHGLQ